MNQCLFPDVLKPWSAEGLEINVNDSFNQRSPTVLALIKLKKSLALIKLKN